MVLIKNIIAAVTVLVALFIIITPVMASPKGSQVEAEGYATIVDGRKDAAREQAINDAFRRAVEQAVGVMVESETLVKNFELISDKVYSKSSGYIKKHTILNERVDGDAFRVRIQATVFMVKLEKALDDIGLIIKKAGKPRLMLLIAEQNVISDKPSFWWGPGGGLDMGIVENTLMSELMPKGFIFVDRQVVLAGMKEVPAGPNLSNDLALKLAKMGEAEVVVIGQAVAKAGIPLMGTTIRSCQATISVRVLNADSGEPIASVSTNDRTAHVDPVTGGSEALKKASIEMARKLMPEILAKWKTRVNSAHTVKLSLTGMKFGNMKNFKEFLQDKFESVEEIYDRSYRDGIASLDLEIRGDIRDLAEGLNGTSFSGGHFEVLSFTSNVVEVKFKSK
jgi:hypothetical protein